MADPVSLTVGGFVAYVLGLAGEAVVKSAVGEAVKDGYQALKARVAVWAAGDVAALEKTPTSEARKAIVAEIVDALGADDQQALRELAQALADRLKAEAPAIGLDVGLLEAKEAQLGNITVTRGIGARIQEVNVEETFRTGDISVGPSAGKR